jgi:hypothetical protein
MKIRMTIATTLVLAGLPFSVASANAATPCDNPTMRVDVSAPSMIQITGTDITRAALAELWRIATATKNATVTFGKVIAQDQNWLDSCEYPGLGLGAGSGMTLDDRAVTLWIWSTGVDLSAARLSIYQLIGQIAVTTTTSTTSTTSTTTAPPIEETNPVPDTTTTLPMIDSPEVTTTTTEPEVFSAARVMSVSQLPVKASSVKITVQKKKIAKVTAKKKKVVTIKTTPKRKKKK